MHVNVLGAHQTPFYYSNPKLFSACKRASRNEASPCEPSTCRTGRRCPRSHFKVSHETQGLQETVDGSRLKHCTSPTLSSQSDLFRDSQRDMIAHAWHMVKVMSCHIQK